MKNAKWLWVPLAVMMTGLLVMPAGGADERELKVRNLRQKARAMNSKAAELLEEGEEEAARLAKQEAEFLLQLAANTESQREGDERATWQLPQKVAELERIIEMTEKKLAEVRDKGQEEFIKPLTQELRRRVAELQQLRRDMGMERRPEARAAERTAREVRARRQHAEQMEAEAREMREREERERREREMHEREMREREMHEREMHEREMHEREMHEREMHEREQLARRMEHLRVAAENLAAIEMHELAERLTREADEIDRVLHRPGPGRQPPPDLADRVHEGLNHLQRQMEELRDRMRRIEETVERHHRDPR